MSLKFTFNINPLIFRGWLTYTIRVKNSGVIELLVFPSTIVSVDLIGGNAVQPCHDGYVFPFKSVDPKIRLEEGFCSQILCQLVITRASHDIAKEFGICLIKQQTKLPLILLNGFDQGSFFLEVHAPMVLLYNANGFGWLQYLDCKRFHRQFMLIERQHYHLQFHRSNFTV